MSLPLTNARQEMLCPHCVEIKVDPVIPFEGAFAPLNEIHFDFIDTLKASSVFKLLRIRNFKLFAPKNASN